jgi:hypothetical protein
LKKTCCIAFLFFILQLSATVVYSQVTTGIWKGIAKQGATTYAYTVKINKIIKDSIFGTTISSSNNFFSETKFKGIVNGNNFTIQETVIIKTNYKGTGSVCLMKLVLKKNNDKLQGSFTSSNKEIQDCGSGTVNLSLEKEKKNNAVKNLDTPKLIAPVTENRQIISPVSKSEEIAKPAIIQQNSKINTQRKIEPRDIDLLNTFRFKEDSVMIKIYDNGIIDGDVISLIVNGQVVFDKIKLTAIPLAYELKASAESQFQIEFYAETLGEIPPNTGLITISSASKTSEVLFSSDLKKSAAIKVVLKNNP